LNAWHIFAHRKSAQEAVSLKSPLSILVIAARIGLFIALGAATIYAVIRYIAWVDQKPPGQCHAAQKT
jgi:hypothetical protein